MTRPEQRATEREHIREFLRLAGMTATSFDPSDSPDAVLTISGRRVGVEHSELEEEPLRANQDNLQALEGLLVTELRALGARLRVGLGLSDASAPAFRRRSDVEELARRLASFVARRGEELPARISGAWLAAQGLPEMISLHVDPSPQPAAIVTPAFCGPVHDTVHMIVRRKEAKLARYRAVVDEAWLLLVTGAVWTQATDSALTEGLEVECGFHAVFLLDLRERVVQKLRVKRPPTPASPRWDS